MPRKIIKIDEHLCVGCSLCVRACKEEAIKLVDGRARLVREDYCDGLGNCLPVCPVNAISFRGEPEQDNTYACPEVSSKPLERNPTSEPPPYTRAQTHLNQWPVQIKLVSSRADYFRDAHLLVSADCSAFACGNFHGDYMKDRITIIGCPKLDEVDYCEKLTAILRENDIKSLCVVRMEVPCCAGIAKAAKTAIEDCAKQLPWQTVTLSIEGEVL